MLYKNPKLNSIIFLMFVTSILLVSCKKDVPSSKANYMGEWKSSLGTIVRIEKDGSGYWEEGSKYIEGKVKFKSPGFEIKALGIRKKFTVDQEPTLITTAVSSFYTATFNGEHYNKQ